MKVITQEEFDNLPRNEFGIKVVPAYSDLTAIREFGERCSFGECCSFGEYCRFGERCSFGECCSFGEYCRFGERCSFGEYCSFGECCRFGERCRFGECCRFGKYCSFGECCNFGEDCSFGKYCSFGEYCRFGECCRFGEDCSLIGLKILNYKAVDQIGKNKRKLYCWNLEGALYFQAGCFFGKKDELLERVDEEYGKDSEYHLAIEFLEKIITK